LLEALLKLLETGAPALNVLDKDTQESLGAVTLDSINREIARLRDYQGSPI
jgi:hypothetical protein